MSAMKYCQGPLCHTHKTKDRIRGPKGYKQYETRKRSSFPYHDEFCSLRCQDDWFRMHGQRAIDHYGRTTEPQCVMADGAWYKSYHYRGNSNYDHYIVNDLLGERRPITEAQYNDDNFVSP
jgi:hypothetical protein|tara:strand:+ start:144 stop:506 length:363 start_codon:yes stop_codon:yes gene_type:complete